MPRSSLSFDSFMRWSFSLEAFLVWTHASDHRTLHQFVSLSYDSITRDWIGDTVYTQGDNTSYQLRYIDILRDELNRPRVYKVLI